MKTERRAARLGPTRRFCRLTVKEGQNFPASPSQVEAVTADGGVIGAAAADPAAGGKGGGEEVQAVPGGVGPLQT